MNKGIVIGISVMVVEFFIAVLLLSPSYIQSAAKTESRLVKDAFGTDSSYYVIQKANHWYEEFVVKNNVEENLVNYLLPTAYERTNSLGMSEVGRILDNPVYERVEALLDLVYWFFRRIALFAMWLPISIPALLAAVAYGLLERQIKRTNFSYTSPTVLRYSWRACGLLTIGFFVLFLMPFAIPPILIPFIVSFVMLAMGISLSHLAKKI